jgi:hypothetical protein
MNELAQIIHATERDSMSDDRAGLGPRPYTDADPKWPTVGYDAALCWVQPDTLEHCDIEYTRAEWLALAAEMEARWQAWAKWCQDAPDSYFLRPRQP